MRQSEVRTDLQSGSPLRLLHLTDLHLFGDPDAELRGVNTIRSLETVLEHIEAGDWFADAALVTGDLIQDDSREAYVHCNTLLRSLDLPVYLCPGNHDVRPLMADVLSGDPFRYCEPFSGDAWSVISLDSCVDGRAGGELAQPEIDRLRDHLSASKTDHVLVCLHHPPLPLGSRWLDGVGLAQSAEFMDIVAQSEAVRGVIFGHAHQDFDKTVSGTRFICTPSTCRQFKPGSVEFAVDEQPPAYRRLSLFKDGTIESELIWIPHA